MSLRFWTTRGDSSESTIALVAAPVPGSGPVADAPGTGSRAALPPVGAARGRQRQEEADGNEAGPRALSAESPPWSFGGTFAGAKGRDCPP